MTLPDFLSLFDRPRKVGHNWVVKCPAHADRSPSLSVTEGKRGNIVLHCFTGCTPQEIVDALNLKITDLFDDSPSPQDISRRRQLKTQEEDAARAERDQAALCYRADQVVRAATGIDISGFNDKQLDRAMNLLADAYAVLNREKFEEAREEIEEWVSSWPAGVFDRVISELTGLPKEAVNV